jgi:hypothetical protein
LRALKILLFEGGEPASLITSFYVKQALPHKTLLVLYFLLRLLRETCYDAGMVYDGYTLLERWIIFVDSFHER